MNNRYKNKYFSIMGDSISTYEGYIPKDFPTFYTSRGGFITGIYSYRDTWWGQVLEHFGGKLLVNNSWSGSYVCKPPDCEVESYGCSDGRTGGLSIDGLTPDVVFVYLGSNDRGACFPLTSENKEDMCVIENAYGLMLDKIKKNYPSAEIWCITLAITKSSRDPYFEFPSTQLGVPMENYGELIKRVASRKNCNIIDLWDKKDLCDTLEGLHPNYSGMKTIADKVIAALEKE